VLYSILLHFVFLYFILSERFYKQHQQHTVLYTQLINLQKLIKINLLISTNFCHQSEDQKLQNSTTGCCYLSQTKAEVMMMMMMMQYTNGVANAHKVQTVTLTP